MLHLRRRGELPARKTTQARRNSGVYGFFVKFEPDPQHAFLETCGDDPEDAYFSEL
jgi:hypothetical protein